MYDIIIIGSGAAGMTAGIYAVRRKMKTLIIGRQVGGQIAMASTIENYPGFKTIDSFELIQKMEEQVKSLGVEMKTEEVEEIIKKDDNFLIITNKKQYQCKTVVLAMGLSPRWLNVQGEKELSGKGVSYCANCDGPLFKNKVVAIIGGGNAALDAAEVLSKIARQVFLIHRTSRFRGFEALATKVQQRDNIEIIFDSNVQEIIGQNKLEKIKIINNKTNKIRGITLDGVFIEIGREAYTEIASDLVELDVNKKIIIDLNCQTSQSGVFAAGDVTQVSFNQIIIACGQGAVAALSAYRYLQGKG
ncbi:thioredoxin-disulfide reductase [Patescibacteria group bacterium]|nr:thioredoxin-disulfide reductase [Patescibacteria group bacterium]